MKSQHRDVGEVRSRGYGPGDGIRDVVEFQIEKYLETQPGEPVDRPRAFCRIESASNFNQTDGASQAARQHKCRAQPVVIESEDYSP
jgi:hypothetical protein